ncbi:DNA (cytosine-5-)-methyltransferase [Buttiauxella gaviniae]|uniref:DNA (cytosine-5-)-methyltransferase n=1 Tax=Buttiauxella gaviniae TaxID=82990 RepID=UPI0039B01F29
MLTKASEVNGNALLVRVCEIYGAKAVAELLNQRNERNFSSRDINNMVASADSSVLVPEDLAQLNDLLPAKPANYEKSTFRFIDLFAGIGGIRNGFESIGGKCVFTSEWNPYSVRTYKANWYCDENEHVFNQDIRDITLSHKPDITEEMAYLNIDQQIPDHDVLLAGFPCQPFSLAGVSKKNSLGRKHGFECETQGTLFFDVSRIIRAKRPAIFVLENVKNLKSHDKGNTFRIIMNTLDELGYDVSDAGDTGASDPKIIDGKNFLPQHRERIVLVGFRRDLNISKGFSLSDISNEYPDNKPCFKELLDEYVDDRYILTPKLWEYLYNYAKKHKEKGNGFGFGLIESSDKSTICRTLSARYNKDGSEILVNRGFCMLTAENDFNNTENMLRRPRRLTPRECARIMGFEQPGKESFRMPCSDTQSYKQFGNSVIVPVFAAVARLLAPRIQMAVEGKSITEEKEERDELLRVS